ncbi:glycosyltransferase [Cyanobium sp. ATX 6F1]|uniref:glycosyltransferase n=1 Tax=unclassified Cyanobium TaxID=2627006 RepID=UPI0020CED79B|nr:glycosyltransferase [Cyanobium sp. ATX 6F1]MCP9915158.1 glycosyltransferase [Cyanobium sp. ATX 6F1]
MSIENRYLKIGFVCSCLNEAENVWPLYKQCVDAYEAFKNQQRNPHRFAFSLTIADNASTDHTAKVLAEIANQDERVKVLLNARNYGPEISGVNALANTQSDIYVLIASDLEDPPELVAEMLNMLVLAEEKYDGIVAIKSNTDEWALMRAARHIYYSLLDAGSRNKTIPNGFHGFGCYKQLAMKDAIRAWRNNPQGFRTALYNSLVQPIHINYKKPKRRYGTSSYGLWGYVSFAAETILSGDALNSRFMTSLGATSLLASLLLGITLLIRVVSGQSGYTAGTPTIMLLVLLSLGVQSLMLAMLSFQIENQRMTYKRPRVRAQVLQKTIKQ